MFPSQIFHKGEQNALSSIWNSNKYVITKENKSNFCGNQLLNSADLFLERVTTKLSLKRFSTSLQLQFFILHF